MGGLREPCPTAPARRACASHRHRPARLWIISCSGCVPVWLLPSCGRRQSSFDLQSIVAASVVESSMKYLVVSEADRPIKCQCNGELYLALEMENLSLTDGYQVQPVPWRQSVNARDAGRLKSQFMRSAKLPVRDGAAGSPQACNRPIGAGGTIGTMAAWPGTEPRISTPA